MKKIAKIAAGITLAASLAATAGALAGCSNDTAKTGVAYGLVHGGSYVACATIKVDGDTVKDLTLVELELPTKVKDDNGDPYATVTYGNVTLTYDETSKGYNVGEQAFLDYLKVDANAEAYYKAVMNGEVKVKVNGQDQSGIMTENKLSKEKNGYWSTSTSVGSSKVEGDSKWIANRDLTVAYVKANGVAALSGLTKNDDGYWVNGTISTGATWNDLNPTDKKGKTYYTYAELITLANTNANK